MKLTHLTDKQHRQLQELFLEVCMAGDGGDNMPSIEEAGRQWDDFLQADLDIEDFVEDRLGGLGRIEDRIPFNPIIGLPWICIPIEIDGGMVCEYDEDDGTMRWIDDGDGKCRKIVLMNEPEWHDCARDFRQTKLTCRWEATFETKFWVDDPNDADEIRDICSNIDIPEGEDTEYQTDTWEVEKVTDKDDNEVPH